MTYDGDISKIIDHLIIESGNVSKEYVNTSHGIALNISGNGKCQIIININQEKEYDLEDKYPILSLDKHYESSGIYDGTETNAEYYCYLYWNSTNSIYISIDLKVESIKTSEGVVNEFNQIQVLEGDLFNGWNIINGNKSTDGT
ncbi:MAG: hypothetical protein ACTSPB_19580 [Candidatus Thorarchaeota archaeon]